MAFEGAEFVAGGGIPLDDGFVVAAAEQSLPPRQI